jgi:hypothetical protein
MAVVMPRYTPRLPFALIRSDEPELAITDANWKHIENAYGHELSPDLKEQIYTATWQLLAFSGFEKSAQPVAVARKRIKKIEKAATQLQNAILDIPEGVGPDAAGYADHLISGNLGDTRINGKLKVLGSVMVSLVEACHTASLQLESQTDYAPRKGAVWQSWVCKLKNFAAAHGLPTAARKDTDLNKTVRLSPFVELVDALQIYLPKDHRRNRSALAKAIHDARNELPGRKTPRRLSKKSRH